MARQADSTHGSGGRPTTKLSGAARIMVDIDTNPDLTDIHGQDMDEYGGGDLCYPKNGGGLTDPVG